MPQGARYLYDLNFFCGFIVASGSYWLLCKFFPIPATSDKWMEVGDEITEVSVAYGTSDGFDEESATGSEYAKGAEEGMGAGVRERKVGDGY